MADVFGAGEGNQKKADGVADAINRMLQNLVLKCARDEGIRDFIHVGVIGYGAQVGPAFSGALAGRQLVSISEVGNSPSRVEQRTKKVPDGAGGIVEQPVRFPVWFDPIANGGTPMSQALGQAKSIIDTWLSQHPNCFPPIVINITDGEASDGDPSTAADEVRKLKSNDGDVLLFNIHCSSQRAQPTVFPNSETGLPDQFAQQLFRISSALPPQMATVARTEGLNAAEGARGFVFNAGMVEVIKALDIGTRPSAMR
jgi:hypothetical protein